MAIGAVLGLLVVAVIVGVVLTSGDDSASGDDPTTTEAPTTDGATTEAASTEAPVDGPSEAEAEMCDAVRIAERDATLEALPVDATLALTALENSFEEHGDELDEDLRAAVEPLVELAQDVKAKRRELDDPEFEAAVDTAVAACA